MNIGRSWTKRVGDLENWTILMDAICVSSLNMNPILVAIVMELIFAGIAAQIFFTLAAPVCVLSLHLFLQL